MWSKEMPKEMLLIIFKNLDVKDLPRVALVCRSWYNMSKVAAAYRSSLSICIDPNYDEGQVNFRYLSRSKCGRLIAAFPNITKLCIDIGGQPLEIDKICYLLQQWSSKLVDLSIYTYFNFNEYDSDYEKYDPEKARALMSLIDSVNQLPQLKKLDLDFGNVQTIEQIDLPILARLQELSIKLCNEYDYFDIHDSLVRYGQNNQQLQLVTINSFFDYWWDVDDDDERVAKLFLQLDHTFCTKLNINFCYIYGSELVNHAARFASFTELAIIQHRQDLTENISLARLTALLASSTPNLWKLTLRLDSTLIPDSEQQPDQLTPLPSVCNLSLLLRVPTSHNSFLQYLQPSRTFPNLTRCVIRLNRDNFGCTICSIDENHSVNIRNCANLLVQSFRNECHEVDICTY